jgi:hypothetical protein
MPFMRPGARIRVMNTYQTNTQLAVHMDAAHNAVIGFSEKYVVEAAATLRLFYVSSGDVAEFMWDGAQIICTRQAFG